MNQEPKSPPHPLSVPASWLQPVCDLFAEIARTAAAEMGNEAKLIHLQALVDRLPLMFGHMDHAAFAATLTRALGAAAIAGALDSKADEVVTGLSTEDYQTGVAYLPLDEAARYLDRKTAVGSALNSTQWKQVPAELRDRSMFSSRVESARFLTTAKQRLSAEMGLQQESLANGKTAFFDRDSFINALRGVAQEEGITTDNGAFSGSIRDIRSAPRLGLIYDIQTSMAEGFARRKMDLDPDVLDAFPAQRLVRVEDRVHPRDWQDRWGQAAAKVRGVGVYRGEDMVALKTSEIWMHLGPFGNPWPPFDYGSGMGVEDVDRDEAESLGLIAAGESVPDTAGNESFNHNLETGTAEIDPEIIPKLRAAFGNQVKMEGDVVSWLG